ncbi:hypothetical protein Pcinc_019780 [Petrolisthes cinctipes]|uniref:Uncharacterized protein n=1 Tax=Petrolisthes cinctipes TaxID=88211 RepID=A0AAE1KJW2_PETCI|nr:hypothetical protein Pcinc_019780 [Petrolisthes cinctipes]
MLPAEKPKSAVIINIFQILPERVQDPVVTVQIHEIAHDHVTTTSLQYGTKALCVPGPLPHKVTEIIVDSIHGCESSSQP